MNLSLIEKEELKHYNEINRKLKGIKCEQAEVSTLIPPSPHDIRSILAPTINPCHAPTDTSEFPLLARRLGQKCYSQNANLRIKIPLYTTGFPHFNYILELRVEWEEDTKYSKGKEISVGYRGNHIG